MALRKSTPVAFRPKGLSDAADGTNAFPGAMQLLTNLVPAPDMDDAWVPRPASTKLSSFSGVSSPGFVSAALVVGNIEYGMIASSLNAGKDQPYAYNLLTNTFLTVNGILSSNVPASPSSSGAWTPPIMALVGTRIVVTHPGFPGGTLKFGWFDISGFTASFNTDTHGTNSLTSATNMLQSGVQPGMLITGTDIPANTYVVSIASNGFQVIMSNVATGTSTNTRTIAGGTTTAPLWGGGDTNINNLPSVPVSVAQFNGRAYYAVGNGVVLSDSLLACNVTNATQALAFANGLPVTALGGLPLQSPITGGVVQAIIAFQGVSGMQQITGDPVTNNLSVNLMNVATGTLAPLSITPTNFGLAFISPEGMRIVEFNAQVSNPIGDHGTGVTVPFISAVQPSRICAAATADVIRITTQNGNLSSQPFQEYWFDITRRTWSGPHTFPASLIQAWSNTFVMHPVGLTGTIWKSDATPGLSSTYTENGTALQFISQTSLMPDNQEMCENSMIETTVMVALPPGYNLSITTKDEQSDTLDIVNITTSAQGNTIWGSFTWGAANWSSNAGAMRQYRVPWSKPLVFKQASLQIVGPSAANVKLGNNYFRVEKLGYLMQ